MKRLLLLHSSDEMYGSDRSLLSFAMECKKYGSRPLVVLPADRHYPGLLHKALRAQEIDVYHIDMPILRKSYMNVKGMCSLLLKSVPAWKAMDRLIKSWQPDALISNSSTVILGGLIARRRSIPHIFLLREMLGIAWHERIISTYIDLCGRAVVANSEFIRKRFIASRLTARSATFVDYPPVEHLSDSYVMDQQAARSALGLPEKSVVVALIGRINAWKGHRDFLAAAGASYIQLGANAGTVHWVVIGDPLEDAPEYLSITELSKYAYDLGIGPMVRFVPFLENLRKYMKAIDIVCVTSTQPEPFGRIIPEAMLAESLVIAPNVGGPSEIVEDGRTGLLFRANDVSHLAQLMTQAIDNPALRRCVGVQARAAMAVRCRPESYCHDIMLHLQELEA